MLSHFVFNFENISMKKHISIFLSLMLSQFFFEACEVDECDEVIPEISLVSFTPQAQNKATVIIAFRDCDGDLGLKDNEDPTEFNLFMEYYYLENGDWKWLDLTDSSSVPYYFRVPFLDNRASSTILEGEIEIQIQDYFIPGFSDTIRYTIMLRDRAMNESEIIETPIIIGQL